MKLIILFLLIFQIFSQENCTVTFSYTFSNTCVQYIQNKTKNYPNQEYDEAIFMDRNALQVYKNQTNLLKSDRCRSNFVNFLCSKAKSCNLGRIVKPCWNVCFEYLFACSYSTIEEVNYYCDQLSGVGKEFATRNDQFCESGILPNTSLPCRFSFMALGITLLLLLL